MEEVVNDKGFKTIRVKQHDKLQALGLLMRATGLHVGRPEAGPTVNVAVQVNNTTEASNDVLRKLDAMLPRQRALPAPSQQPMRIDVIPEHEPERVESK